MRRSATTTLIAFIAFVAASLATVFIAGWGPLLGLDLQGGVAVVLKPTTAADAEQVNQAVSIIRQRVDAIGVAEPDISVQGDNVVIQLPGVKDRERALELVGSTAELRFRPVLGAYTPPGVAASTTTTTAADGVSSDGRTATTAAGSTTSTGSTSTGSTASTGSTSTTAATTSTAEQGLAPLGRGERALGPLRQATTTTAPSTTAAPTTTAAPATTSAAEPPATTAVGDTTATSFDPTALLNQVTPDITPREQDLKESQVVLPEYDDDGNETIRWQLGPTIVTGDALVAEETNAVLDPNGAWLVQIQFKDGDENVGGWRRAAAACYQAADPTICPTGRLAAVLDGVVISAPQVNDTFQGSNSAVITGNFDQDGAEELAQQLRYGALPVQFERQQSQDVSATVGRDALRAGVAAGLIGLAIVALYILAYYRILGLVAIASLALSFGLLWSIIAWLGSSYGLALSLSGVVGIIVSIGVSIDSNIVYFEQIKDDMASGRTLRSSAQRAFHGAMSTIIKADLVSLIGAGLLYFLTVGPVKGFALFLGLSTLLDLVASYFFMRPAVVLLSYSGLAARSPKAFGIPKAGPVPVKAGA